MSELKEQVRSYLDDTSSALSVDEVLQKTGPIDLAAGNGRRRPVGISRGLAVGVATAAVVALIIGLPLLLNWQASEPAATTTPPPSTRAVEPTTTALPPTTSVEVAPTTVSEMTIEVTQSVVPGLGTLIWERVDGDRETLPERVDGYDDGRYVTFDRAGVWRSDDGYSWSLEAIDGDLAEFDWIHTEGRFAIAGNRQGNAVFARTDGTWSRLPLDESVLPSIGGISGQPSYEMPITSGSVTLVPVSLRGSLGLEDVYGTFEVDCGEPEPCTMEPWLEWDPLSEGFRITDPDRGVPLAMLVVDVDGDSVRLVDGDTGEVVVDLRASSALSADDIVDQLSRMGTVGGGGVWVSSGGGTFEWQETPWGVDAQVLAAPAGGFVAFEFVYDWQGRSGEPFVSANVWTSQDGREWQAHGEPSFTDAAAEHMMVTGAGDALTATIITGYDDATGLETFDSWTSSDGVAWERNESQFAPHVSRDETNFGYVATALPQSTWKIWVSTDGDAWHEVIGPPGSHEPTGAGYAGAGGAGDLLFVSIGEDAGPRTLWVGRFEP